MRFGAYHKDRPRLVADGHDIWQVIEDGVAYDPEDASKLLVGSMQSACVSDCIDEDDIVSLCDDGRLKALHILECIDERYGECVDDGRAHFLCSDREAQEALDRVVALYTDRDTAAGHIIHWAGEHIEFDPSCYCEGKPAIPIEYVEGEWVFGGSEGDAAAVITYAAEPSPETGHVGWCWWALGKMGDAKTVHEARQAAESVLLEATS